MRFRIKSFESGTKILLARICIRLLPKLTSKNVNFFHKFQNLKNNHLKRLRKPTTAQYTVGHPPYSIPVQLLQVYTLFVHYIYVVLYIFNSRKIFFFYLIRLRSRGVGALTISAPPPPAPQPSCTINFIFLLYERRRREGCSGHMCWVCIYTDHRCHKRQI